MRHSPIAQTSMKIIALGIIGGIIGATLGCQVVDHAKAAPVKWDGCSVAWFVLATMAWFVFTIVTTEHHTGVLNRSHSRRNYDLPELKEELERMSPEQLNQLSAFVVRRGAQYASSVVLQYEQGDALLENGHPYFLI